MSNVIGAKYHLHGVIIIVVLCLVYGLLLGTLSGDLVFENVGVVTIASVFLFAVLTIYSSKCCWNFSLVLPFMLIAFPTSFDDIIPGVYLESPELKVVYPIVCHTELYLLISLVNYRANVFKANFITYFLIISFLLTSILCVFTCHSSQYVLLLISGQYPIRLLILIILVNNTIRINFDRFLQGVCFSIIFLAIESVMFTILSGQEVLTSGSLGNNTFGNVMGQLFCMLMFYLIICHFKCNQRNFLFISSFLALALSIMTGTRMALIAILSVSFIFLLPRISKKIKTTMLFLFIFVLYYFIKSDFVSDLSGKMDLNAAISAIEISKSSGIDITRTETTSSLMTRLDLWITSSKMFVDNFMTGIGWNMFNVLKYKYGFDVEIVIIDPHNGYFSFLSQLGVWAFVWIYFLFYTSWKIFCRTKNTKIKTLALFNAGMTICEFTNAGSYKFSVLSFLLFISVYISSNYEIEEKHYKLLAQR